MNNFILLIIFSLLTKVVFAISPTDGLGFHWRWDNGCVYHDFHHPYSHSQNTLRGDKKFSTEKVTASKYLSLWKEIFNYVHESVPHLSPRENDWLDGEMKSSDPSRRTKAYESIELKQRTMLYKVHMLLSFIKTYNKETNQENKKRLLYRFAYRLDSWSLEFAYDYIELKKKGLVADFPDKWKIKYYGNEKLYANNIRRTWNRASHFVIKCYVVNY